MWALLVDHANVEVLALDLQHVDFLWVSQHTPLHKGIAQRKLFSGTLSSRRRCSSSQRSYHGFPDNTHLLQLYGFIITKKMLSFPLNCEVEFHLVCLKGILFFYQLKN